jgi:hypothetical protein
MRARIAQRLHAHVHRLPGMPPHSEADRLNQNSGARRLSTHNHVHGPSLMGPHPALKGPSAHHARQPRILVGWQNWIAGLFAGRQGRG